jgi:hypothetical protein
MVTLLLFEVNPGLCLLSLKLGPKGGKFVCSFFLGFSQKGVMVEVDLMEVFIQCMAGDVVLLFVGTLSIFSHFHRGIFLSLLFEFGSVARYLFADS